MKIGVYNSAWANMGNAFFALGLISFLRKKFPWHMVLELDEPFPYMARTRIGKFIDHAFQLASLQEADVYVFSGPILAQISRPQFGFSSLIKKIKATGREYMILSSSASEMSKDEVTVCSDILLKYPPIAFSTRDIPTYEKFKKFVPFCHNGICGAFLIPFVDGVADIIRDHPYFVSSFYKKPEPYFSIAKGGHVSVDSLSIRPRKYFLRGFPRCFARHFEFLRDYPNSLDGYDIVRVHQGFNPAVCCFNYGLPNSFVSYNPHAYLSVYKGCEFVVSDRVHACAAALAYGHPARLLDVNDRMGIFARMGIFRDSQGVMRPLNEKKYGQIVEEYASFLSRVLPSS